MIDICFPSQVIRPSTSVRDTRHGLACKRNLEADGLFVFRDVLRQSQCNRFQAASVERAARQIHEQHSLQLATLRDKLQNKIALDIPSLQLGTQQSVSLQVARKVEASGTFRDVARQSAVCDMASAACHATFTSTLRDTLRETLYHLTLRLDVTTRDGTSSKSLIELVKFLDWNRSNTVAIPVDSCIVSSSDISRKSNNSKSLWSIQMITENQRMS